MTTAQPTSFAQGLTIKAREVKRKPMTSLAYGPWPITIRMPWKNDMGSVLTLQVSVKKKREAR